MRILEVNSISKEETYIYYINRYKANAVMEFMTKKITFPFSFDVEIDPLGRKTISVTKLPETLEYPVLPVQKELKKVIMDLAKDSKLP